MEKKGAFKKELLEKRGDPIKWFDEFRFLSCTDVFPVQAVGAGHIEVLFNFFFFFSLAISFNLSLF